MVDNRSDAYTHYLVTAGMCAIALALRIHIANDAFWLDEIWSYYLTGLMESPTDAFSKLRIDNNHLLNTLTMYWSGEQANWTIYRIPAVLCGVVTVALMGMAARLLGLIPWLTMLLTTLSLPLIQYSAEARGYSSAAMFGLAAWLIYFARLQTESSFKWLVPFWLTCVLGLLSHLTFVFVLAALGLTGLSGCIKARELDTATVRKGLIIFSVPALFLVWIYLYFYGQTSAGGGETSLRLLPNLLELGRYSMGAPRIFALEAASGALLLGMMAVGLWALGGTQRLFFSLVFLLPALLLTLYQPDFFYPRYLLVCVPFIYLLVASSLSNALRQPGPLRLLSAAIVVAMVCGSTLQYRELAKWGKGDYPQAIEDLFNEASGEQFTVGSDFDFRNKALLDFYSRYRPDSKRLLYVPLAYEQAQPTDYFFVHNQEPDHQPAAFIKLKSGTYQLLKQYPYSGLSGWNWYLYAHENSSKSGETAADTASKTQTDTVAAIPTN